MEGAIPDPPVGASSPDLAMKALVGMCPHDMDQVVSNEAVAAFLTLAQRFGWNPRFVLESKIRAPYCDFPLRALTPPKMEGLTVLEWLSLFSSPDPQEAESQDWPATPEGLRALAQDSTPPIYNHEWLMAWMILNGATLWKNHHQGLPVVLLGFLTRNHFRLVSLLLQQPGAPSLENLLDLPWAYSKDHNNIPKDYTLGKWLFEHQPELVQRLLRYQPAPLLKPELVAYASLRLLPELNAKGSGATWRGEVKRKLDSRLLSDHSWFNKAFTQETRVSFGPNGWLASHRALFSRSTWNDQTTAFHQAVVDYCLSGPHGPKKFRWIANEQLVSPAALLLNTETTHPTLKGSMPVLAALLLDFLFRHPCDKVYRYESWATSVSWNSDFLMAPTAEEEQTKWESLDGILASALDQTFGENLPMRGLVALVCMLHTTALKPPKHLVNHLPSSRLRTLEGLLFGVADWSDFLEQHFEDAMQVTHALPLYLEGLSFQDPSLSTEAMLLNAWHKALQPDRSAGNVVDLRGRKPKLAIATLLLNWTGLWHPAEEFPKHPAGQLLGALVASYTAPKDPFGTSDNGVESDFFVTMALITRRVDWLGMVMNGLAHRRLTPSQVEQCEQWLEMENAFVQKHHPSSKTPPSDRDYPLRPPILAEFKQALLQTQLSLETTDSSQRQRL